MKSLKTKVMASLAMLLVAAVMMTSSSFAWYTISTQGELSQVNVEMTATDTMEIAVAENKPGESALGDSGNQQTWGTTAVYNSATSSITQAAFYGTTAATTSTATPSVDDVCTMYTPEYDATNRLKADLKTADAVTGSATYTNTGATPLRMNDSNGNACAYVYDFWLRSNKYATAKMEDNNSDFGSGTGETATFTVVFVDEGDGKVIGSWDKDHHDAFEWDMDIDGDYYTSHVNAYVYINGATIKAKDIDSNAALPIFKGAFKVTGVSS